MRLPPSPRRLRQHLLARLWVLPQLLPRVLLLARARRLVLLLLQLPRWQPLLVSSPTWLPAVMVAAVSVTRSVTTPRLAVVALVLLVVAVSSTAMCPALAVAVR